MAEIPKTEPSQIRAGDTIKWRREDLLTDYPASEWTLKYYLLKSNKQIVITAAADGDLFNIEIAKTVSKEYPAGTYSMLIKVSNETEELSIGKKTIEILPDLTAMTSGYDDRSKVKIILDALEATVAGNATSSDMDVLQKQFGDKSLTRNPELLMKWLLMYRRFYRLECAGEKIAQGLGTGRKIQVRFKG